MQLDLTLVGRAREALGNGNVFGALRDLDAFLARHPVLTPDDIVHQAEEIDRAAYKKRVNDLVDEIGELWRTGYFDGSRSAFDRYVEEDLEGQMTDWREARQCLYFSDNAGAAHNQLGVEALDWGGGVPWCEMAYYALIEDVRDGLRHEGLLDQDPPHAGTQPCASCEEWTPVAELEDGECLDCRRAA